jgi:hypothetical protein
MEDADQFNIIVISAWRGNPEVRTTMEFEIHFEGDELPRWRAWDRDLADSAPFGEYVKAHPPLYPLIFDLQKSYQDGKLALNRTPITEVKVGDTAYLSLRFFSTQIYDQDTLDLPRKYHIDYVVSLRYTRFLGKDHKRIDGEVPVFKTTVTFDHIRLVRWGKTLQFADSMVLVDEAFIRAHLCVLDLIVDKKTHTALVKRYS